MRNLAASEELDRFMRYQKIESQIWNDEDFIKLSVEHQRLFLYLLTSPHGNLIGLYVLKQGYACEDLKAAPEGLRSGLEALSEGDFIAYDYDNQVVWIKKFLKHNPVANQNQKIAMLREIEALPKTQLIQAFINHNADFVKTLDEPFRRGLEAASKGLGSGFEGASEQDKYQLSTYSEEIKSSEKEKEKCAREENLESVNLSQNFIPPPILVGSFKPESYSAPSWLIRVFGELQEEVTGQLLIPSALDVQKVKTYFEALSKLNLDADEKEIYDRATLGAQIAFEGYVDGTGYFHWLDKSPPTIGWFANNAAQVNLAVTARLSMTEEDVERERKEREQYEDFKNFAEEVDAQVEKDLAEGRKPLVGGVGLPKPRTEH